MSKKRPAKDDATVIKSPSDPGAAVPNDPEAHIKTQLTSSAASSEQMQARGSDLPADASRSSVTHYLSQIPEMSTSLRPIATDAAVRSKDRTVKYEVVQELARGGMGAVHLVNDNDLNRQVAMKTILPEHVRTPQYVGRFLAEAQATGQLEHPNIVPVHDLGINASGEVYFTMKLVRGETLQDIIEKLQEGDKEYHRKYTFTRRMIIAQQVCDAIAFAHSRNIIHRDLKPENIMVGEFGEVMVMDWGLAKIYGKETVNPDEGGAPEELLVDASNLSASQTMEGSIVGTPLYMPPEQAQGQVSALDNRSDLYSLGAVIYELACLHPPHPGKNVVEILRAAIDKAPPKMTSFKTPGQGAVPVELHYIAFKALEKDPAQRHQSAEEMRNEIEAYLEGRFAIVCPHTALKRVSSNLGWVVDNYVRLIMFVLVSLILFPIIGGVVWYFQLY